MFNLFHTLSSAVEHSTVKKVFGSYKNAALVEGNLNLLHKLQDEGLCNSKFIEPDETHITLDMLFKSDVDEKPAEIDLTGTK